MSENLNVFNTLAHTLTDNELSEAISLLAEERKKRQGNQLLEMKSSLYPGDRVEWFSHRTQLVKTGTVIKVKTKKAIVEADGRSQLRWDIPMGMLKKLSG
tara:strand:- start:24 stop:323 length:300 start_codon:yes stop_codon:yes gene_type:complete